MSISNIDKLKIGRFSYSNLFPIFYMLERECDCSAYEFVEGVPSELNRMLREGNIDISPSSSIEYLRNKDIYDIIEGHSISSFGPVGSVFLFSQVPIESLSGRTILTTSQSETSVALLRIVLEKFYGIRADLKPADLSSQPSVLSFQQSKAYLLIGDDALRQVKSYKLKGISENSQLVYTYDLGEIWHRNTGLPFTFALWISRKDCCKENAERLSKFKADLDKAKQLALKNFKEIASKSPLKSELTEEELVLYWQKVSYDFGDEHKKGLELFRKYSAELDLI